MKWIKITYLLLGLLPIHMLAQERSLTVTIDREAIRIGEQITMQIEMHGSASDSMRLPQIADTLIKEIEVLSRSKVDTAFIGDQLQERVLKQSYTLTSFDSGYFAITPLIGKINDDSIASNPFLIAVHSVEIDTAKGIVDIKEIAEVPFAWKEWLAQNWHWIALVLLGLAANTILVFWLSKKRSKPVPEKIIATPTRPAHEIALEKLELLKSEGLWQKQKVKRYYSDLTDILREYIELEFQIPAMEQTTDEIITSLRHTPDFTREEIDRIKRLLFLSDLVKFAKEQPVGQENEQNFDVVKRFVVDSHARITAEENRSSVDSDSETNLNGDEHV